MLTLLLPLLAVVTLQLDAVSQAPSVETADGRTLYRMACAACHGSDGKGVPPTTLGFDTALPDFTDCAFSTPEADADWMAVVHQGGTARAFDRRMPAFGDTLSDAAIQRTIEYVRSLCGSRAWPRGELNLPRALATEKAFPENEAVLTFNVAGGTTPLVGYEFLYERRLGSRSQLEISVPLALRNDEATGWQSGLGDVALAVKHVVFHRLDTGTIVSAAGEVILPTGKESQDFGSGVTVFEPFVAVGQLIRSDGFLQLQAGMELSTDRERVGHEFFLRTAVGKTFTAGRFGRSWSPIVELLGAREIGSNEKVEWDLVPQMQVALSRRQHIMVNAGVRFPLTDRREREVQVLAYLLWDWFDGGFFDGWR